MRYLLLLLLLTACGGSSVSDTPITVVAMGDSEVAGYFAENGQPVLHADKSWPALVEAKSNGHFEVTNLGVGGATTQNVYDNQFAHALSLHAGIFIFDTGINDARFNEPVSSYYNLYTVMLMKVKQSGAKAYVVTPMSWPEVDYKLDDYRQAMRKAAAEQGAIVIDAHAIETPALFCDKIDHHPCSYDAEANLILSSLNSTN